MTVTIRAEHAADKAAVGEVITTAFGDDGHVAALARALRARPDLQAGLVADAGGEIVGHTHLSIAWIDDPARLVEVLVLSPLAVSPAHQRTGIGTALLAEAARAGEGLGVPAVFLEGSPRYYSGRGWLPAAEHGFTPPSVRIPLPAFQFRPLSRYDAPELNGALVYNDTFWRHDCVGLRPD